MMICISSNPLPSKADLQKQIKSYTAQITDANRTGDLDYAKELAEAKAKLEETLAQLGRKK